MTKRQRAQVVELLRCAADTRVDGIGLNGMFDGERWASDSKLTTEIAWDAVLSVQEGFNGVRRVIGVIDERYRYELLEAAQRVEEGSWP